MKEYIRPRESVRLHCLKWCMNVSKSNLKGAVLDCTYSECILRGKTPILGRIKAYCKQCSADFKPYECDGIVLNVDKDKKCPLHQYRMGKNRNIKHNRTPVHLEKYHFTKER